MLGGVLGMLRFPDLYTRIHAANVADPLGAVLLLLGLALASPSFEIGVRLLLLAGLVGVIGPIWSHIFGSAAHVGGLSPIAGRYTAPRPGAPRSDGAP
jgi:multicomponent Na+:H+ antiporter subunit G